MYDETGVACSEASIVGNERVELHLCEEATKKKVFSTTLMWEM